MTPDTTSDATGDNSGVFTITEAAKLLGVSVRTIQRRLDDEENADYMPFQEHGKRLVKLSPHLVQGAQRGDATGDNRPSPNATQAETIEAEVVSSDATGDTIDATVDSVAFNRDATRDRVPGTALAVPENDVLALLADVVTQRIRDAQNEERAQREKEKPLPSEVTHKLLLTLDECAVITGLSRQHLRGAINDGVLKGQIIGRGYKITKFNLEKYVKGLG